jgi:hypothetical protein
MANIEPLWGVAEVSVFLGVPIKTLYQWKWQRIGPPVKKVGKYLRYVPSKVQAWAEQSDDQAA